MLRLGFHSARITTSIINATRRCVTVAASQLDNANINYDDREKETPESHDQMEPQLDLTEAAEAKAQNGEGFFDNNVIISGIAGKCMYNIDDDNNVHAIRLPIRYEVKGYPRVITANAMRSDLITFLLNNVEEGVPVRVRGTFGRPSFMRNFTINAKHVQILSNPVEDA